MKKIEKHSKRKGRKQKRERTITACLVSADQFECVIKGNSEKVNGGHREVAGYTVDNSGGTRMRCSATIQTLNLQRKQNSEVVSVFTS